MIELEDVRTGVAITDLGLNDFRMDLLNYLRSNDGLGRLPTGLHAVVPADPARGLQPGAIFALRNRNHGVNIVQLNRLHPYYLVYVSEAGQVVADHTQVKRILDLARAACRERSEPVAAACRLFNHATDDGRNMEDYSGLLDHAIGAIIERKADQDLDTLFGSSTTTALTDTIAGLDDFELVCFLVVQAMPQAS